MHNPSDLRSHLISEHTNHLHTSKERNIARVGTSKEQEKLHLKAHLRQKREQKNS